MSDDTQNDADRQSPRRITIKEFHEVLAEQDVDRREDLEFICPKCGTTQTAQDLIDAGAGENFEDVATKIAFSCVGRYDEEVDCDWTLGGLLQIHELEVIAEDGTPVPRFLPANTEDLPAEIDGQSAPEKL